jgi:hypothetical protein
MNVANQDWAIRKESYNESLSKLDRAIIKLECC